MVFCKCHACSETQMDEGGFSLGYEPSSPSGLEEDELPLPGGASALPPVPFPDDVLPEDLSLELEWFKPNGVLILPNSKETRITSNTYVFLNMFVMHRTYGILHLDSTFVDNEPVCKLVSSPEFCTKCNRELLSYSPKQPSFSYCKNSKKILGKFRIICSSNSHYIDKQLITITAMVKVKDQWLQKTITNIRINSKKPRDESDPSSFKKRRKRKTHPNLAPFLPNSAPRGVFLEGISPNSGPASGNTLVTLRGKFNVDSEVMFGNIKIKPFLQKPETDIQSEEDAIYTVDTLLCFSPIGTPGAAVQVYVKEGEFITEPRYFNYTPNNVPKKEGSGQDEKVRAGNPLEFPSTQQIRDLTMKFSQLEQLVCGVLQQQYPSSMGMHYRNAYLNGDNALATNIVLKSVLLDILQAKQQLKDVETMVMIGSLNPINSLLQQTECLLKQDPSIYAKLIRADSNDFYAAINKGPFGLPIPSLKLVDLTTGNPDEISKENQMLSKKIFSQFAIPAPNAGVPSMFAPKAFEFQHNLEFVGQRTGLEKLVAAIETIEPTC